MDVHKEIVTVTLDDLDYKVPVWFLGSLKATQNRTYGFSNGFCVSPKHYFKFFDQMSEGTDLFLAPEINGIKVKDKDKKLFSFNKSFSNNSLINNKKLYIGAINAAGKVIFQKSDGLEGCVFHSSVFGHSTGGGVTQDFECNKVGLINPLMPVDYGVTKFILKGLEIAYCQGTFQMVFLDFYID